MANASCSPAQGSELPGSGPFAMNPPQLALLDFFFPGFNLISGVVQRYLHIDLNLYIPLVLLLGGGTVAWRYFSEYFWGQLESHFMSTVDVRTDDEAYNMLMAWVATQRFAQGARRFVVNTNLNSRSWFLWRWEHDDDEDEGGEDGTNGPKKKALSYTPTFGSHYFWYKGRLLIFRRSQNRDQATYLVVSEREEISISCFGRNPWVLKELLLESRLQYMRRDERKTLIYRGTTRAGSTEPTWQRCMARTSRPFSTVILNEKVKADLIEDVSDYLNPATRRWYANRGIPYRRGYLLYGPPGTGKSSLSLALAGFFKMRIYIVSLSSVTANEENLSSLFAELPRRCVVLLEDIDTAGLTHTREESRSSSDGSGGSDTSMVPGQVTPGSPANTNTGPGRLSLSGLLNILDGVASQEGRVLIMTTNHVEKLDKALIRPGRVDMIVKFDKADRDMIAAIFRAIYAPLEGDDTPATPTLPRPAPPASPEAEKEAVEAAAEEARKREEAVARMGVLAEEFADKVPAHEFSPAELQGYLMKNKRDPEGALARVEQFIVDTRKERKEKEIKEAEEKRKAAEEKRKAAEKEAEEKKKQEEKKRRKEAKKRRKASRKSKEDDSSDSQDGSESESEVESETASKKQEGPSEGARTLEAEKEEAKVDEVKAGADSGYGTP